MNGDRAETVSRVRQGIKENSQTGRVNTSKQDNGDRAEIESGREQRQAARIRVQLTIRVGAGREQSETG